MAKQRANAFYLRWRCQQTHKIDTFWPRARCRQVTASNQDATSNQRPDRAICFVFSQSAGDLRSRQRAVLLHQIDHLLLRCRQTFGDRHIGVQVYDSLRTA